MEVRQRRPAGRPAARGQLSPTVPLAVTAEGHRARGYGSRPGAANLLRRPLCHLPSMAQEEAIRPRETDLDSLWSHWGHHLPPKCLLICSSTFTCRKCNPSAQPGDRSLREVVIGASGCACSRPSPGNGALEPDRAPPHSHSHLARAGCQGELNQAPSSGTAKRLGDISGVERRPEGRGWPESWVFRVPGALVRISARPGLVPPASRRLLCGSRSPLVLQPCQQFPEAFGFY